MSAKKIYWRSRDGAFPPSDAHFFLQPFSGSLIPLGPLTQEALAEAIFYKGSATYTPQKEEWTQNIHKILNSGIEKVVLSRRCQIQFSDSPKPFAVAAALQKKSLGACLFCIETPEFSFLGATPERLFRREERQIFVEAIAGTRKRGITPQEDAALKQELLHSDKDLREIEPVQRFLKKAIEPLVETSLIFTPISIHETAHVQHLYSQGTAQLKEDVSDTDIVKHLHPTPALAGFPQAEAKKMIEELEPFSRGFYGGVLGWTTERGSEWVVAIRCCLLEKKLATLFSGTGIVQGSHSNSEWEELDQKLKLFEGILL